MHDNQHAIHTYRRIADALHARRAFAPRIAWDCQTVESVTPSGQTITSTRHRPVLTDGPCEVVQHQRESPEAYASRVQRSPYINHLASAVARFCAYLGRKTPTRTGVEPEILRAFAENTDGRGSNMDSFIRSFAFEAKARGCGIVLLDGPTQIPKTMGEQISGRKYPRAIKIMPEHVSFISHDDETGSIECIEINARVKDKDGKRCDGIRGWDLIDWYTRVGNEEVERRPHGFRACPALVFTEDGSSEFGFVGKYSQIVGLSVAIWNTSSLIASQLSGPSFPILTMKVADEYSKNDKKAPIKLGQNIALEYTDERPDFIAPDLSNIDFFIREIESKQNEIAKISGDSFVSASTSAESGEALRRRFEPLNAELAQFASGLQTLERKMWELYCGWCNATNTAVVEYPTDYNITDTMTEIGILEAMKAAGMPQISLIEKMRSIAGAEFDSADAEVKDKITSALDEMERALAYGAPADNPEST
jgi:hypothetical protein